MHRLIDFELTSVVEVMKNLNEKERERMQVMVISLDTFHLTFVGLMGNPKETEKIAAKQDFKKMAEDIQYLFKNF